MVSLKEKFRTQLLFIILMIGMIAALIRLFDLQCLRFEVYQKRALQQQQSVQRVKARRGRILDRNGKILAISSSRPAVWADPGLVKNVNKTAVKLSRVLNVQAYKIKKKLYNPQNPSNRFVWINKKISDAQAIALRTMIKKREIPGVYLKYVHNRIYPRDELLGNVLGFCNSEGNGAEGLEYAADNNLRGTDGYFVMRRDNRRNRFFVPEWVRRQLEPVDGNDIYLTIDEYIQEIANVLYLVKNSTKEVLEKKLHIATITILNKCLLDLLGGDYKIKTNNYTTLRELSNGVIEQISKLTTKKIK